MNGIDLALAVFVLLAGVRGAFRGFFRETFAILALAAATLVSFRFNEIGAQRLEGVLASTAPQASQAGVAFVVIFFVCYVLVSAVGFLFERYVSSPPARLLSTIGGGVIGILKGAALASFVALFVYLFVPSWSTRLMTSNVARALVQFAGNALRFADPSAAPAASSICQQLMK